jgi:hypothetical protein
MPTPPKNSSYWLSLVDFAMRAKVRGYTVLFYYSYSI